MKDYIKDMEGSLLEVTDLRAAIAQAAEFLDLRYKDPSPAQAAQDLKRQKYWKDVYIKLCRLRELKESTDLKTKNYETD
ncbi:hypothetical protein HDF26_002288 [Pedobacter cryoconitis]|uniref:hypothetical protein n=1 Tax=Pedobacter cryoconitis TaxID=188932 RepID=UPI00161C9541|nr:hypothetical protein [Pedobacter cryoconitis]MBB6271831.1 hypothetical protein [Pedobacter cryoconitis]